MYKKGNGNGRFGRCFLLYMVVSFNVIDLIIFFFVILMRRGRMRERREKRRKFMFLFGILLNFFSW